MYSEALGGRPVANGIRLQPTIRGSAACSRPENSLSRASIGTREPVCHASSHSPHISVHPPQCAYRQQLIPARIGKVLEGWRAFGAHRYSHRDDVSTGYERRENPLLSVTLPSSKMRPDEATAWLWIVRGCYQFSLTAISSFV